MPMKSDESDKTKVTIHLYKDDWETFKRNFPQGYRHDGIREVVRSAAERLRAKESKEEAGNVG